MSIIFLGLVGLIIGVVWLKFMKTNKEADGESLVWCISVILLCLIVIIAGILQLIFVK